MTALASLQVDSVISYAIAIIIPALDAVLPVLPSETVIIALGVATAGSADPRIALLVACAAVGAFLGDNLSYLLGRRFGPRVERRFFRSEKGMARRAWAERSLERYGMPLIVVCRFIPGGRTAVTLCCGIVGYDRRRFVIATVVASVIWAVYSFFLGRLGGQAFEDKPWAGLLLAFGVTIAVSGLIEAIRRIGSRRNDQVHEGVPPDRLSPMTPARTSPIDTSFRVDTASPRKIMPTVAAPTAPIPVHTAYAAPTSSSRSAIVSSEKLTSAHTAKVTVHHGRVIPWLSFSATANRSRTARDEFITHAIASPL